MTFEKDKEKEAKVSTARNFWITAVNNQGGFGRWGFVKIDDPWDAQSTLSTYLKDGRP